MEPPVAVAEYRDGKVLASAPTQNPQAVQETMADAARHQEGRCHLPRDTARRRLRTQVEARSGGRGGCSFEATGQAGKSRLDARRRHSLRLLSLRRCDVHEGRDRAEWQADGVAATQVFPPIDSTFDAAATYGDDEMGLGWNNRSVRYPEPSRGKRSRRLSRSHRMAAQRGECLSRVRDSVVLPTNLPTRRTKIRSNICWI